MQIVEIHLEFLLGVSRLNVAQNQCWAISLYEIY